MTDLQVRAQANLLREQELEETRRKNQMAEAQHDAEMLAKYGHHKYGALTDAAKAQQEAGGWGYDPGYFEAMEFINDLSNLLPFNSLVKLISK